MNRALAVVLIGLLLASCGKELGPRPPEPGIRLDRQGPYLILSSNRAGEAYGEALGIARSLHPDAEEWTFDPADPGPLLPELTKLGPRYVMIVLLPDELDVNLAWRWLELSCAIDEDPLPDCRTGFVTGATPEAAAALLERTAAAIRQSMPFPDRIVDDLGPNLAVPPDSYARYDRSMMLTGLAAHPVTTISHGRGGFPDGKLGDLAGFGLVHIGGHGYPDGVVTGLTAAQAGELTLERSVVFNGACYTGVTGRWFREWGPEDRVAVETVPAAGSFALRLLETDALAYLASLHPDHGIPVYQEMERLAATGASLGEVMRGTMADVVLGAGGELPGLDPLVNGAPSVRRTPTGIMLVGTASRVLFGDPALVVTAPFAGPALEVTAEERAEGMIVTATVANPEMRCSLTDTFHSDLSIDPKLFNDRARIAVEIPEGVPHVSDVKVRDAESDGGPLPHRLVAWTVEALDGKRILHAQVDFPTRGYMDSEWRSVGARVRLDVTR